VKQRAARWTFPAWTRWLCALLCTLAAGRARAYQDPQRFAAPIDTGGGGGRFFTGSPADAYTCKVCHTLGKSIDLRIAGLPLTGYQPGRTYRMVVDWRDDLKSTGFEFEVTDGAGRALGQLSMPSKAELTEADLCQPSTVGLPDLIVLPVESSSRTVASAVSCGGHQATVDWTAPTAVPAPVDGVPVGTVAHFNGSFVASDDDGTVAGDSVTDFQRVIDVQGAPPAREISAGCHVAGTGTGMRTRPRSTAQAFGLGAFVALWMWQSRRRTLRHRADNSSEQRIR
jgi:hypothetical protein